jgi:hypothetical protein
MSPGQAMRRALFAVALASVTASHTRPAVAEPAGEQRDRARELAAEATRAFSAGDFRRAVTLVRQAYASDPEPVLLYNLARALEASGDEAGARDAYRAYLTADPRAADRGAVEGRIAILEQKLREREQIERERKSQAGPGKPRPVSRAQAPTPSAPRPARAPVAPWIAIGAGATSLGTGVVLGLVARSEREDGAAPSTSGRDAQNAEDRARSFARWANITLVAGVVLSAAGVTWLLVESSAARGRAARPSLRAHVGLCSLAVSGQL